MSSESRHQWQLQAEVHKEVTEGSSPLHFTQTSGVPRISSQKEHDENKIENIARIDDAIDYVKQIEDIDVNYDGNNDRLTTEVNSSTEDQVDQNSGLQCDPNSREPVFCGGKCYPRGLACEGRCEDPSHVWAPWRNTCIPEAECRPEKSRSGLSYMCNGMCIPIYISCNNTCLESALVKPNRREELFASPVCQENQGLGTEALHWSLGDTEVAKVNQAIGGVGIFCMTGTEKCNGSCSIDPKRPYNYGASFGRRHQCSETCSRASEWPCDGACISNMASCGGECKETHWKCRDGKCIPKKWVCDGGYIAMKERMKRIVQSALTELSSSKMKNQSVNNTVKMFCFQ